MRFSEQFGHLHVAFVAHVHEVEGAAQAGEHAQRQHVDLEDAERVDIVLVPLDDGAAVHRRFADRHQPVELVAGDDEAAHMLAQMPRKAMQFLRTFQHHAEQRIGGIEPERPHVLVLRTAVPAPVQAVDGIDRVVRQAEHLGGLAQGAARTVGDHIGGQAGVVAAIFGIDVLHYLFAPLVLEIDIDVGWLVTLGGKEAAEDEVDLFRVHLGDAQAEAHHRIGRRAPALAEDLKLLPGMPDDVVHGEEIRSVALLRDQGEFRHELGLDLFRNSVLEPRLRPCPGQAFQRLLRGFGADLLGRIIVFELIEAEVDAGGEPLGLGDRLRVLAEQPQHFRRRLEVPLGIGLEPPAGRLDAHVLADAGDDVLQHAAPRLVIEHIVAGEHRHAGAMGEVGEAIEPFPVAAGKAAGRPEPHPPRAMRRQPPQHGFGSGPVGFVGHQDEELPLGEILGADIDHFRPRQGRRQIVEDQPAIALLALLVQIAQADQLAQPPIGVAVGRVGDEVGRAVGKAEPRAHQIAEPLRRSGLHVAQADIGPHHPGEAVAVGKAEPLEPEHARGDRQFLGMRAAAQERKVRGRDQLDIAGGCGAHEKNPCRNQRGVSATP